MDHVLDAIRSFKANLRAEVDELGGGTDESQVVVPHATTPNRNDSSKTVPLRVAQACSEVMKTNDSPVQAGCTKAKKKRN